MILGYEVGKYFDNLLFVQAVSINSMEIEYTTIKLPICKN